VSILLAQFTIPKPRTVMKTKLILAYCSALSTAIPAVANNRSMQSSIARSRNCRNLQDAACLSGAFASGKKDLRVFCDATPRARLTVTEHIGKYDRPGSPAMA